jgi:hypothetical protein
MKPVPDFFQMGTAQARLDQVRWLRDQYHLPRSFFVRVFRLDPRASEGEVAAAEAAGMERLWPMFLHVMSFVGFSVEDGARLINSEWKTMGASEQGRIAWAGRSIRGYLEELGLPGALEVERWLTSFRFADRYAPQSAPRFSSDSFPA